MHETLKPYEAMSQLTSRMVEAARDNDWDLLETLEQAVGVIRNQLQAQDAQGTTPITDEPVRIRKRELILRILADDREIRRHTEPWIAHVRTLLAGSAAQRTLRQAYGNDYGVN